MITDEQLAVDEKLCIAAKNPMHPVNACGCPRCQLAFDAHIKLPEYVAEVKRLRAGLEYIIHGEYKKGEWSDIIAQQLLDGKR